MSVSTNRLQWLINEIHSGRSAFVSFSYNPLVQREKVKFVLEDSSQDIQAYRPCLLAALSAVKFASESSITSDKGHRSSNGKTIVEFWLQQPKFPVMPDMTQPLPCTPLNVTMDTDSAYSIPRQSHSATGTPLQEEPQGEIDPNLSATVTDTQRQPPNWEQLDSDWLEIHTSINEAGELIDEPQVHRDLVSRSLSLLDAAAILKAAGENVSGQEMKKFLDRRNRLDDDFIRWLQKAPT